MSILEQKQLEIQNKLSTMLIARTNAINAKVSAYRAQLEAEPLSKEILDTQNVLKALNDVIAYEKSSNAAAISVKPIPQPVVEQVQAQPVEVDIHSVADIIAEAMPTFQTDDNNIENTEAATKAATEIAGRPGMSGIELPERR